MDHSGSTFDSFLEQEGIREEVEAVAIKRVLAWQLDGFEATEIAEQIGAKPETVRSNLRHARVRLKEIYTRQATETIDTTTQPGKRWK